MSELRRSYHERLLHLEDQVLEMGNRVLHMLAEATAALVQADVERAEAVERSDDLLDELYESVQHDLFTTLALQAPVARDLRLLGALLHTNVHLERMGDLCVNIARTVRLTAALPGDPALTAQLEEMGMQARRVISAALEAFARRDVAIAGGLRTLDEPLDRLNRGLFRRLVHLAGQGEAQLDWAMRMVLVARFFERLGDHGVDIGEQAIFAATGQPAELTRVAPAG